ncbi:MAG: SOS response-associated peptidase family protein, partial [Nitrosomonas sp.]
SACSKIAAIHNRMPVILKPENYQAWLDTTLSKEEMLEILKDDSMYRDIQTIPIRSFVNNPRNNDPMCIKPL